MSKLTRSIVAAFFALSIVALFEIRSAATDTADDAIAMRSAAPVEPAPVLHKAPIAVVKPSEPDDAKKLLQKIRETNQSLDKEIESLIQRTAFGEARTRLMALAANAVEAGNKSRLAHILALLGNLSVQAQELDTAEVFLLEALDVYAQQQDTLGVAHVNMQLGRMHIKSRELARNASYAYDDLLVARWKVSHGEYEEAELMLNKVAEQNISINRYGAAASALDTLHKMFTDQGRYVQAENAASEAAKLYASSGQIGRAHIILDKFTRSGLEPGRLQQLKQDIAQSYAYFEEEILQIERSRDYKRLYNHYSVKGDQKRAWHFRQLATQSLSKISKRAMFHRQPDVMAVLYNSNEDMDKASDYLASAGDTFQREGLDDLSDQSKLAVDAVF